MSNYGVFRSYPHHSTMWPSRIQKAMYRAPCREPEEIYTLETGTFHFTGNALGWFPYEPLNGLYIQVLFVDDDPDVLYAPDQHILWVDDDPDKIMGN